MQQFEEQPVHTDTAATDVHIKVDLHSVKKGASPY